jgi:hypothetical protein
VTVRGETNIASLSESAATRVSDDERERHAELLSEHAAHGRLTTEELSERLERVFSARTRGELDEVVEDLPAASGRGSRATPRKQQELSPHLRSFVLVNALLIAVWALTGAGYFWPVWPLLGWGIGIASHVSQATLGGRCLPLGPCAVSRAGRRVT